VTTIHDVADLAGVSTATVSRVLNCRAGVSPVTRERVHAAIGRLGFTPSMAAQRLRGGVGSTAREPVVGVVAPVMDDWAGEVLKGVSVGTTGTAVELVVVVGTGRRPHPGADAAWAARAIGMLRGSVDGVVLLDAGPSVAAHDVAVVAVGRRARGVVVAGPAEAGLLAGTAAAAGRAAVAVLLGRVRARRSAPVPSAAARRAGVETVQPSAEERLPRCVGG